MVIDSRSVGGRDLCAGGVGRPCLSGCSDPPVGSGDKMAIGVSRRSVRPLVLGRLSSWAGSNRVAGSWPRFIGWSGARRRPGRGGSGGRGEHVVAEVAQGVVAAAGELAGHGQQRELAVQARLDLPEVGVVG